MAMMTFHTAMNMDTAVQWSALVDESASNLTRFVIYDGFHSAAFFGYGLTWDTSDGAIDIQSGTFTSYKGYENGRLTAEYDGLAVSAALTEELLVTDGLPAFFELALSGNDTITGSGKADLLRGFDGKDFVMGGLGPDELHGGAGRDRVFGHKGRDDLYGEGGDDTLDADGKSDTLTGGEGADLVAGGAQPDRFVFLSAGDSRAGRQDTITDFSSDQRDRIDLSAIDASTDIDEDQTFRFIGDDAFSRAGQVRFEDGLLEGDIDGDGTADFAIAVDVEALSKSDLIL